MELTLDNFYHSQPQTFKRQLNAKFTTHSSDDADVWELPVRAAE